MQKQRSAAKVNYVFFFIILQRLYFVQIHTFWKLLHVFFVHNILGAIVSWPPGCPFTIVKCRMLFVKDYFNSITLHIAFGFSLFLEYNVRTTRNTSSITPP